MFQPLGMARRRKKPKPARICMTQGCGATIASWKWLCDPCFARLPYDRKRAICAARAAREPHRVFGLSKDAAEWLAEQRAKLAGEG